MRRLFRRSATATSLEFSARNVIGMRQVARDMKPTNLEDLSALIALYRPGPLDSGMIDKFIDCKNGKTKITYVTPLLELILKDTYGQIVYQEQIMQIAQRLGGYSLGQADLLRRAMGKKKPEEMEKQREIFVAGSIKNGVSAEIANNLFDVMVQFAEYCFNKSHSQAYAMLTYQTAYLKTHYPTEYMTALLSSVSGDQEKVQGYIAECQMMNIPILHQTSVCQEATLRLTAKPFALVCLLSKMWAKPLSTKSSAREKVAVHIHRFKISSNVSTSKRLTRELLKL